MEQIIIATHVVKPSSPTPKSSKTHKLSLLDQVSPPVYLSLIFFYQNDDHKSKHDHEEISRRLKQSLSNILTVFYPLAGTVNRNSHVDCNDRGAAFVETLVQARLQQFIQNPKMEELKKLLPADTSSGQVDNPILSVKASFFDCGGIAVGVCFPHKIADTSCFVMFMNAWAAACRNPEASGSFRPSFDLALRFPPKDYLESGFSPGVTTEKMVMRRLVFKREKVEKLRREAAVSINNPSRVEAVSASLWRSFIDAHKVVEAEVGENKTTSFPVCHMVFLSFVPKMK